MFDLTSSGVYFIFFNNLFQTFPVSNLKNTLPGVYPGNETTWIINRSARISPADLLLSRRFRGESVIRLSLGKLSVNLFASGQMD